MDKQMCIMKNLVGFVGQQFSVDSAQSKNRSSFAFICQTKAVAVLSTAVPPSAVT